VKGVAPPTLRRCILVRHATVHFQGAGLVARKGHALIIVATLVKLEVPERNATVGTIRVCRTGLQAREHATAPHSHRRPAPTGRPAAPPCRDRYRIFAIRVQQGDQVLRTLLPPLRLAPPRGDRHEDPGPPPDLTSPALRSDECRGYSYLAPLDTDPSTGPIRRRGPHRTGLNGAAGPDATDNTAVEAEIAWAVETSRDGERWHFFGKAWTRPGEPLLVHGLPRFVRYRRLDGDRPWSAPLERSGSAPLTLLRLDEQAREELWPGRQHAGLPVLLPPGEEGRLLRFERSSDGESFSWSLEFRGRLRGSSESRLGRTTR
jgi:hypothetical protein